MAQDHIEAQGNGSPVRARDEKAGSMTSARRPMTRAQLEEVLAKDCWGNACTQATNMGFLWADVADEVKDLMRRPSIPTNTREVQVAVVNTTGSHRPVPAYHISFEEIGKDAVNGSSIGINGVSREEAVLWLRSAADLLESGKDLRLGGFVVRQR